MKKIRIKIQRHIKGNKENEEMQMKIQRTVLMEIKRIQRKYKGKHKDGIKELQINTKGGMKTKWK